LDIQRLELYNVMYVPKYLQRTRSVKLTYNSKLWWFPCEIPASTKRQNVISRAGEKTYFL